MKKKIISLVFCFLSVCNLLVAQWFPVNLGTSATISAIHYSNSNVIYVAGFNSSTYTPVIFKSTNGGSNWISLTSPPNLALPSVLIFDADGISGLIAGVGPIYGTSNGGLNWFILYSPSDTVIFNSAKIESNYYALWIVGNKATSTGIGTPVVILCPSLLTFENAIFKRLALPSSWNNYELTGVSVTDSNVCYISAKSGGVGRVLKTSNGGINWSDIIISTNRDVWDIKIQKESPYWGFAVGGANDISSVFKTTNNGNSWNTVYEQPGGYLRKLNWRSDTMYAVGQSGIILRSFNVTGGDIWNISTSGVTANFRSVHDLTNLAKNVYVGGEGGAFLKTTNAGQVWVQNISTDIPDKYFLSQNYPNPFNPTTNIKFAIIKNGNVTIKLYDILGRECSIVLNQILGTGTYEVPFNASNLSSGIYFYKIESGAFTDTKRMVVLK